MKNILVTGCAGFIGMHITKKLLENNQRVLGVDNLNNYYDVNLKKKKINFLKKNKNFIFYKKDLKDPSILENIYIKKKFKTILHLAAQAGVRYSLKNPKNYLENNVDSFLNILEFAKNKKIKHLIYASSSSVYGLNTKQPFSEEDNVNHPISMYAVTKRTNELMAHSYSHLYNLPTTGIRFFTVYGPYGRPDMALFKFTKSILKNNEITLFNKGNMYRDFTYIDDTIDALYKIIIKPIKKNYKNKKKYSINESKSNFRLINIGNNRKTKLMDFVRILETNLKKKAKIKFDKIQMGDVMSTVTSNKNLKNLINMKKPTSHKVGIKKFVNWFLSYHDNLKTKKK